MTRITEDAIDAVNHRIQHMDEDQIGKVWDEFAKEQPALVGYVLGESKELKVADAREDVAYILTIILLSYRELQPKITAVSEQEFETSFNNEFEEMEEVFHDGFDESDAMAIMDAFCQPELLQFVAAIIYNEGDEDTSNFTEEEAGLFIVIFKTVISLLNDRVGVKKS